MSETAFVLNPTIRGEESLRDADDALEEICSLTQAISLSVIHAETINVNSISPSHFLGKGTVERIAEGCEELEPDVVIVNQSLSPVQQRNLERALKSKVIDRTGLILEIFGERATTKEGRIQVELAALEYQKSRLVRSWTHLERQRGGAGFMGGPGETQIEIDRRIISDRIASLKKQLDQVRKTRDLGRKARERVPFPIVALVGYTNAGKSTLFNTLTQSKVMAEDLLFATLDPTMRKLELPHHEKVILADTVGFISDLPTSLIAAFRSTLEQLEYANVILHVRDITRHDTEAQKQDVIDVMNDLGIEYEADPRIIEVWNKIDALDDQERERAIGQAARKEGIIALSAVTGQGTDDLLTAIEALLSRGKQICSIHLKPTDGKALSWLYEHAEITARKDTAEAITLELVIDAPNLARLHTQFGYEPVT